MSQELVKCGCPQEQAVQIHAACTAVPGVGSAVQAALSIGITIWEIIPLLIKHAGDIQAIISAIMQLIDSVKNGSNPAPFPNPQA